MHVLVCGGGVIGAAVAYYLSLRGIRVTVVERSALACAASGKSGGFLALDWCDGSPLAPLARRSFALHAALAETLDGDWGYRPTAAFGGAAAAGIPYRSGRHRLGWLAEDVAVDQQLGTAETAAQLDPAAFTAALMGAAQAGGATLRIGAVSGLIRDGARVTGVVVDGEEVSGDAVVIAMGPWSILAAKWLPMPGVFGLKGHSLVFDTGGAVPAESVFLEYREEDGTTLAPELFPRADGTTYVCGIAGEAPLPVDPSAVEPEAGALDRLEALCRAVSPVLAAAPIVARQACYRPVTRDGLPMIGPIPGNPGVYVATGHSVWGMLNAPATGEALAELILDGAARQVDLTPFSPARLPAFDPARLMV